MSLTRIICALLATFSAQSAAADKTYEIPLSIVKSCELASLAEDLPRKPLGVYSKIKVAQDLYQFLTDTDFTSKECKEAARVASQALERYYFRKSLAQCDDLEREGFHGEAWFCDTLSIADWREYDAWENSVFIAPPIVDLSGYLPAPKVPSQHFPEPEWNTVGTGEHGSKLHISCTGDTASIEITDPHNDFSSATYVAMTAYNESGVAGRVILQSGAEPNGSHSMEFPPHARNVFLSGNYVSFIGQDSNGFDQSALRAGFTTSEKWQNIKPCVEAATEKSDDSRKTESATNLAQIQTTEAEAFQNLNAQLAISILEEHHNRLSTCLNIGLQSSLYLKQYERRPADAFCNPRNDILVAATNLCGITRQPNHHQRSLLETLKNEGEIYGIQEHGRDLIISAKQHNQNGRSLYTSRGGALCGKFPEVRFPVTIEKMNRIDDRYYRVEYTIRQESRVPPFQNLLFVRWRETSTVTLVWDGSTWKVGG